MKIYSAAMIILLALCALPARSESLPSGHSSNEDMGDAQRTTDLKVGLALGAGGASGLAHIAILEAFDEVGIVPHRIAGCSIGAIIGSLYASGHSGKEIKGIIEDLVAQEGDSWRELVMDRQFLRWLKFVDLDFGEGGLISGSAFITYLQETVKVDTFEQLTIPLSVVTADLWTREEVVFDTGDIYPSIQASMAVPGLFTPVKYNGRVLVDGGIVNPVPYEMLFEDCDIVVAINATGNNVPDDDVTFLDALFVSVRVMQSAILREKLKQRKPDIYIHTQVTDVRMLEFMKIDVIYEQTLPAKAELKKQLQALLESPE